MRAATSLWLTPAITHSARFRISTSVVRDAGGLRPVHEWTGGFDRFWNETFDRLDAYVQDLEQARQED